MKNISKQVQLHLRKEQLMHTLEFLITHYTGYFVTDDYDSQKQYYIQEKDKVGKLYAQGDLGALNKLLRKNQKNLYLKRDEIYPAYMERVTSTPFALYKELSKSIQRIFTQKKVLNENDVLDIEFLTNIYKNTTNREYDIDKLNEYVEIYKEMPNKRVSRNILKEENDLSAMLWNDSLSKRNPLRKNSPNGKNWIELNKSGREEHALTYIVAGVDGSNGPIYSIKGEGEKIKFHWADDTTIVIHTSNEYESVLSTSVLKTKHSKIDIKYLFDASFS
ncbi:MAG: hypothetical protein J7577_18335 [Sphingobacteriaceae bacterium]|nr:hypothetical protein [Sphingobacteriaceae bacterium]